MAALRLEPPRNGGGVPNLQQSEIIQPAGCDGCCLPLVSWGVGLCCAYRDQSVSRVVAVCHWRTGVCGVQRISSSVA
jgi:hypothetical protein